MGLDKNDYNYNIVNIDLAIVEDKENYGNDVDDFHSDRIISDRFKGLVKVYGLFVNDLRHEDMEHVVVDNYNEVVSDVH